MNQQLLYEALEAERTHATMTAMFKGIDDKHCIDMQNLHAHRFNAAISKLQPLPIVTAIPVSKEVTKDVVRQMNVVTIAESVNAESN